MTIKELRDKYSLSQSALAKAIGVSASTIGAIEGGRMKVSPKIADAVKATYGEVLEDDPKAENKSKVEKRLKRSRKRLEKPKQRRRLQRQRLRPKLQLSQKRQRRLKQRLKVSRRRPKRKPLMLL